MALSNGATSWIRTRKIRKVTLALSASSLSGLALRQGASEGFLGTGYVPC